MQVFYEETEQFVAFYDIFIRNAFGSYRDILKEVSFNKIMAEWLSFYNNKSLQYNIDTTDEANYPDENVSTEDSIHRPSTPALPCDLYLLKILLSSVPYIYL